MILSTLTPRATSGWLASTLAMLLSTGCAVGPKYNRPVSDIPVAYRGVSTQPTLDTESLGDEKWWEVFQDKQLQDLIRTGIEQNYDVRVAANRILQAEIQIGIARADELPTLNAGVGGTAQRSPRSRFFPAFNAGVSRASAAFAWEPDFWRKYRSATEVARANLVATEWGKRAIISTLVSDIATAYFQLRALDLELDISKRTLGSRQESLDLTQRLEQRGVNSLLDVRQAEQLVFTAAAQITDLEKLIEQQENLISILIGKNPDAVQRGLNLTEQPHAPEVPAGLPSALLERRPDIRAAEQQLVALNAEIGVAKAAYFPRISLTAEGGFLSGALTSLFTGPAALWTFAGDLTQPVFSGGRVRAGVKLAETRQQEQLLFYQQTIQQAFRDVSDALVAYRKSQEFRLHQQKLTESTKDAARLAELRYRAGTTSYLEVLTNQTNSFSAELGLAQAQLNELEALVQIYRSLGGGWQ
jgi:outer membrane protein, multidrug efflux system